MTDRRDFIRAGGIAASALVASRFTRAAEALPLGRAANGYGAIEMDPAIRDLLMEALNAAKIAGASYSDARIGRYRQNFVNTRERQITNVVDTESFGCGVRALVDGTWGFAATKTMTKAGVAGAAREATAIAKANRVARDQSVRLSPAPVQKDVSWKGAHKIDPFTIPVEQKADLLLRANAEALKSKGVQFVGSGLFFVKEEKNYANTDGSIIAQEIVRSWPTMNITAVAPDRSDFQTRSNMVQPMGLGWEFVLEADLVGNAQKWGEEAVQKLSAKPVDVGRYDLILHPSHLWLTIHESIGHPTELDRAMGYEANYAGTSFVAPPDKHLGKLKYGPTFMNVQGDRSQDGGCSTVGFDDDGVKPDVFSIVKNGMFNDYQTTREQAEWLKWWYDAKGLPTRSHGCAHADSWASVQFQRMPNVSLMPGDRDIGWDEIIADTKNGIAIIGDGSFSIDQQRFNAQFGGQLFYEVKDGRITGMLKDVAYQMRTPDFWNAMDMIGGKRSYQLGASFFDGKGQPGQVNAVSHGCVPSRFRQINVINTGRRA